MFLLITVPCLEYIPPKFQKPHVLGPLLTNSPSTSPTPTNHPTTTPLLPLGVKKLAHSVPNVLDVTSNPQHNVDSVEAVVV